MALSLEQSKRCSKVVPERVVGEEITIGASFEIPCGSDDKFACIMTFQFELCDDEFTANLRFGRLSLC